MPIRPSKQFLMASPWMNKNPIQTLSEAEEYTLFGYPHTTMQDCDFLEDIIAISGSMSPVLLDIASGTGRHALEMTRRGYDVTGVDISESMLRSARELSLAEGFDIHFQQCDMRQLDFKSEFDLAYILFNSMGLLTSNDEILDFLKGIHDALAPNGLFVFQVGNLWSYIAAGNFSNSVYESEEEKGGIRRTIRMTMVIGPHNNIYRMHYDKRYWREGNELPSKKEDVELRIFSLNELDMFLDLSGFQLLKVFGETILTSIIEDPNQISAQEKSFHSYIVLAMKQGSAVSNDAESAYRNRRWCAGRRQGNKSGNEE